MPVVPFPHFIFLSLTVFLISAYLNLMAISKKDSR